MLLFTALFGAMMPQAASASSPASPVAALKMPFEPGVDWIVTAADSYEDASPHLTLSDAPLAFDMDVFDGSNPRIVAVGDGRARIRCAATMAIVELDVAGHGVFTYLHLDADSLSGFLSFDWTPVAQGEPLGRMFMPPAAEYVEDWDCGPQYVAGAHLHLEIPSARTAIDGVVFDAAGPKRGDRLTSTNHVSSGAELRQAAVPATELATPASVITAEQVTQATQAIGDMLNEGYSPAHIVQQLLPALSDAAELTWRVALAFGDG